MKSPRPYTICSTYDIPIGSLISIDGDTYILTSYYFARRLSDKFIIYICPLNEYLYICTPSMNKEWVVI